LTTCKHVHNQTNTELDYDRTRSTVLRRQYASDCYKRFRKLKGLIRSTIQKYDAFNIKQNVEPRRNFPFTTDRAKVDAFMDWLNQAEDDGILEIRQYVNGRVSSRNAWQNTYVRRAYEKGIKNANRELSAAGQAVPEETMAQVFNKPIHADALGMLFTRNFNELQGITDTMDQQISRKLAEGFSQGYNPRKIAGNINDRVDKIGITRARTLARTEVIRAHTDATVNRYKEYGVKRVRYLWGRGPCPSGVCPNAVGEYKIGNAPKPPLHPNCTCSLAPVIT